MLFQGLAKLPNGRESQIPTYFSIAGGRRFVKARHVKDLLINGYQDKTILNSGAYCILAKEIGHIVSDRIH